jgi:hypothetical protein
LQLGFNEDDEMVNKIKLINMIERKFSDKFRIVQFNKKLFVTVVGLSQEEHADCPLPASIVRNKTCKDGDKKWIRLQSSITFAATITIMQQGALSFLANAEHAMEVEAEARAISTSTITPPQWPATTTIYQALLAEEASLAAIDLA